jgi:hypothetical protein
MDEIMRLLRIDKLIRMTRAELCSLAAQITAKLPTYHEDSPQHTGLCSKTYPIAGSVCR